MKCIFMYPMTTAASTTTEILCSPVVDNTWQIDWPKTAAGSLAATNCSGVDSLGRFICTLYLIFLLQYYQYDLLYSSREVFGYFILHVKNALSLCIDYHRYLPYGAGLLAMLHTSH